MGSTMVKVQAELIELKKENAALKDKIDNLEKAVHLVSGQLKSKGNQEEYTKANKKLEEVVFQIMRDQKELNEKNCNAYVNKRISNIADIAAENDEVNSVISSAMKRAISREDEIGKGKLYRLVQKLMKKNKKEKEGQCSGATSSPSDDSNVELHRSERRELLENAMKAIMLKTYVISAMK